jgi:glycosyltransferase involved in cell wall biosynthesis
MLTVFTPSFADESNTNAQNLTVKEVVARMDPARFRVALLGMGAPDPRIAARANTEILPWKKRGNTLRTLGHLLTHVPDVYFFPREGPLDAAFLNIRAKLSLRTALVTYVISGVLENGHRPLVSRAIREADVTAGNSLRMTRIAEKLGAKDAQTVYDGVDRRYYYPPSERNGAPGVLFAGSFRLYKRADLVVREAAKYPDWKFRLAGTGEEEAGCHRLAADTGCKNVEFLGHLTAAQLGDEMRRAHIFFFPSELEGHPQVLLQAAACALPSVTRSSHEPDYVVDQKTGLLAKSTADLSEALSRLMQQRDLRCRMSAAAAKHAQQFDWDRITEQWEEIMECAIVNRTNLGANKSTRFKSAIKKK